MTYPLKILDWYLRVGSSTVLLNKHLSMTKGVKNIEKIFLKKLTKNPVIAHTFNQIFSKPMAVSDYLGLTNG